MKLMSIIYFSGSWCCRRNLFLNRITLQRNNCGSCQALKVNVLLSFYVLVTNVITFNINLINVFSLRENSNYIKHKSYNTK